ncbi:MAG: PorV/PorQ family protein [Bacteroidales bacterium]|nr:PorV/PorQ family protein [Bacteroidales bacterium]
MKRLIILFAALLVTLTAGAQSMGFVLIPDDAALAGMAGAGVALHSSSPLDNNLADAALGDEKLSVAAGYSRWMPKMSGFHLLNFSASYRVIPKLTVAVSVKDLMAPAYETALANGQAGGTFRPMDLGISAGAAYQLTPNLSAGVAAKFLSSSLGEDVKASSVAFNLSAKYAKDNLQAGLAVNNIGPGIKFGTDSSYPLPTLVKAGAAYTIAGFTAALEADYVFMSGFMAALGAQYAILDMVFVRAGYHLGTGKLALPSYASLGLGFQLAGFHLDVNYLLASATLGGTLGVGLGYSF